MYQILYSLYIFVILKYIFRNIFPFQLFHPTECVSNLKVNLLSLSFRITELYYIPLKISRPVLTPSTPLSSPLSPLSSSVLSPTPHSSCTSASNLEEQHFIFHFLHDNDCCNKTIFYNMICLQLKSSSPPQKHNCNKVCVKKNKTSFKKKHFSQT